MLPSSQSRSETAPPDGGDVLAASDLPDWVIRALADNGITRFDQVSEMSDAQLLKLKGVGRRSIALIRSSGGAPPADMFAPRPSTERAKEPDTSSSSQ